VTRSATATSAPLTDRGYKALARFRYALRVFQRFSEEAARDAGTTPAQHQLMLAVRGHAGADPPVISDLAATLQLRHHSVVELIDRAEKAGLVVRVPDPADHRRQHVLLTPAGTALLEQLSAAHRDELRRFRQEMNDVLREVDG
jgi:DNA-binding MarR family transcriptional regulator